MSDDSVRASLRSDAPLVVVEAPAGCGKTHQGADYAREIAVAGGSSRCLILTHTHAACSMFSDRTKGTGSRIEIRTIDSVIAHIASSYHAGIGLPADTVAWVRQRKDGYAELALKVAAILRRHPMIAASLVQRYPVVICDEHQDSSGDQHAVIMALLNQGARVRIFADPMQKIFRVKAVGPSPSYDWAELTRQAQVFDELNTPHRWASGCPELGQWVLKAREALKAGGKIDLRNGLPPSVSLPAFLSGPEDDRCLRKESVVAPDTNPLQRYRPILPWLFQPSHLSLGRPHPFRVGKARGCSPRRPW